jgi:transmembrane sensor
VELEEEDVQRLWRGVQARRTRQDERLRQRPLRRMTAGALALALGLLALLVWRWPGDTARDAGPVVAVESQQAPSELEARAGAESVAVPLSDGSRLTLREGAKLEVLENSGRAFTTALRRGRTRFEVKPGGPRRWTVECGPVAVEVVGTVFAVERGAASVVVEVEHGVVLVRGEGVPDRVRRLTAGERLMLALPPSAEASRTVSPGEDSRAATGSAREPEPPLPDETAVGAEPAAPEPAEEDGTARREAPTSGVARLAAGGDERSGPPGAMAASSTVGGRGEAGRAPRAHSAPMAAPLPAHGEPAPALTAAAPGPRTTAPCGAGPDAVPCMPGMNSAPGGLVPSPPEPWLESARRGDLAGASASLGAAGLSREAERASGLERLMLLADVARAGDQAPLAARLLERAVREGGTGTAVALAAFQLGTLRLDALGQPREAAEAFAQVVRLGQPVALVEDALARQVQALARAGEHEEARRLADEYATRYPEGRRLADVRRWAGE